MLILSIYLPPSVKEQPLKKKCKEMNTCVELATAGSKRIKSYMERKVSALYPYRGADKSLARPGRKQATVTEDFEFHTSYL
jgi:hypothetical protein